MAFPWPSISTEISDLAYPQAKSVKSNHGIVYIRTFFFQVRPILTQCQRTNLIYQILFLVRLNNKSFNPNGRSYQLTLPHWMLLNLCPRTLDVHFR